MIVIDGSKGEGGGQIIRTALAMSVLTGEPFEAFNIRKGRCDPGLKTQHLFCIKALGELSHSRYEGAVVGSEVLKFFPGKVEPGTVSVDVGTAGSTTLLMQSLLVPILFGPGKVRLRLEGGTDVPWSQPFDYFSEVLFPHLARLCQRHSISLTRRGYFPKGGGQLEIELTPKFPRDTPHFEIYQKSIQAHKFDLVERGKLVAIRGIAHSSADLDGVAERMARSARLALKVDVPVRILTSYSNSLSPGCGITLWAVFLNSKGEVDPINPVILGADCLGEKKKRAEDVGLEAANSLMKLISSEAVVDPYLADQLVPFLAMVGGSIRASEVTNHCKSNMEIVELFLGKRFKVENNIIKV